MFRKFQKTTPLQHEAENVIKRETKRIQRKRGEKLPENTIFVGRPTNWGNPFKCKPGGFVTLRGRRTRLNGEFQRPKEEERKFILWLYYAGWINHNKKLRDSIEKELSGKDLACWCDCGVDQFCHADYLLVAARTNPLKESNQKIKELEAENAILKTENEVLRGKL